MSGSSANKDSVFARGILALDRLPHHDDASCCVPVFGLIGDLRQFQSSLQRKPAGIANDCLLQTAGQARTDDVIDALTFEQFEYRLIVKATIRTQQADGLAA